MINANTFSSSLPELIPQGVSHQDFDTLVQPLLPLITRYIRSVVRNPTDAEDVLQQVLLKAYSHFDQYRGDGSFTSWLGAIAFNESRHCMRRQVRRREVSMEEDASAPAWKRWRRTDLPEVAYRQTEAAGQFRKVLNRLPPVHRQIVEMRYFDELPYSEVAERLSLTVAGAKMRHHRARRLIERWMQPYVTGRRAA